MRKLILIAALCIFAPHLHAQTACPTPGGTGTTDGGLVSYSCGPANALTTACPANALTKYASTPLTNLQTEPNPCMDFYYNTADGATNHNPTFIISGVAGNISMSTAGAIDWTAGLAATNGTAPNIVYSLVDGTAFAGTAYAGKHFNVVAVYTTIMAFAQINGNILAGATSAQVYVGGLAIGGNNKGFWPNATGYNLYIGGDLVGPITSQTGTWGAGGNGQFTVSWTTGITNAHSSGDVAWAVGTDGSGAPGATCMGQLAMVCDVARAMVYLTTNSFPVAGSPTVPGNGQFFYFGISGGGTTGVKLLSSWKALALALNPSANVTGTLIGINAISPDPDYGNSSVIQNVSSNPNQLSPCGNIASWNQPVGYGVPWPQVGPTVYTVSPAAAAVTTISIGATTSVNGLPVTGANSAFSINRGFSGQGMFANQGYVPVNSDGYVGRTRVEVGSVDNQNPCWAQLNFGMTVPGASYNLVAGAGHGAGDAVETGGCTVTGAVCYNSVPIQDLFAQLGSLFVYGNHADAGVTGAGVF